MAGGAAAAGLMAYPVEGATGAQVAAGPRAALSRLLEGNRRFVAGRQRHPRQSPRRLRDLADGQRPYAITLGCADSRVAPELLFDQGLGDLFDNRVAGAVVDDLVLGSIEYAVEELTPPLLLVLGHERCGAVTATVEAIRTGHTPPGHIAAVVSTLRRYVEPALDQPGDPVENGVRAAVRGTAAELVDRSRIVREHVARGSLAVYGARYDLDTGHVTVLP
ncbi:MAG: carbonic anhydrase [Micromonosporaceae bacterium]